jgi:hypothetical protein
VVPLSAVEEPQKIQPVLAVSLEQGEFDVPVVENLGLQRESAVAAPRNPITASLMSAISATGQRTTAVEALAVHTEIRETRTSGIVVGSKHTGRIFHTPPSPSTATSPEQLQSKPGNTEYARLRKEFICQHAEVRFSVLKDWFSINMLAIFRRASRDWKTAKDLIAIVPSYLEPEAEILDGEILLITTRDHPEKLAIPIRQLDPSSDLNQCFVFIENGRGVANSPAVLVCSDDHIEVVSKGTITQDALPAKDAVQYTMEDHLYVVSARETLNNGQGATLRRRGCIIVASFAQEFDGAGKEISEVLASSALASARQ